MNSDGEPNTGRIESLETALTDVRSRLHRIEVRLGLAAIPAPPPVRSEPPAKPGFDYNPPPIQLPRLTLREPEAPAIREQDARATDDAEMRFGSIVLPRVGAGIVLLGIAYLVGLSIARGWITPWHQFFGAIALCVGFIGVGLVKRRERFDFGQVLIGLGSCGLYLASSAAYAFHGLFSGEALVAQFVAFSFLNLSYGAATPSRTFVGIGLLGGLAAALLPMREEHIYVSLGLNLAIVIPAAAIIAWHKWREMSIASWLVSMAAIVAPSYYLSGLWTYQVGAMYIVSLVGLIAYARSHEDWAFDPQAAFIPFVAVVTGLMGFARHNGVDSLTHEVAWGAALALSALAFRGKAVREAFLLGGLTSAFVWAPFGQSGSIPTWTYLGLSLAAGALSFRALPKAATAFAGLGLGLGLTFYLVRFASNGSYPLREELGILALAMAAVGALAGSAARQSGAIETATFAGLLAASPLVSRFAVLLMGGPTFGLDPAESGVLSALTLSATGGLLALRQRWPLLAAFSWIAFLAAAFVYAGQAIQGPIGFGFDLGVLLAMLATVTLCGFATGRNGGAEAGSVLAAFVGWGVFTRIVYLLGAQTSLGMSYNATLTLGWTLYALIVIAIGFAFDQRPLRLTSLTIFGVTVGKALMVDLAALDPAVRVGLLLLLGGGLIAGGYAYIRRSKTLGGPPAGAAA